KEQPKAAEKGETSRKDKALAILMVQTWEKVARQKITQSFSPNAEILFPPLNEEERTKGPMIIEAEIGGHCIHRIIIGRPRVRKLQVVLSTAHEMLKLQIEGGVITLKSSRLVSLECALVSGPGETLPATKPNLEERVKVAINPEYPKQATAAKTERWTMPTWCHMFNSTLTENARVWFDDLPTESIDSYDDLKKAFLEKYLQQKKCIKDPIELHTIKQRNEKSTEDFVRMYKLEIRDVMGAPECIQISGFVHGITNTELIK
nr:reverse transcriptase domain-containing protein [Tanacetum cinerariifolium]